jgi:hypothetical protein
MMLYMKLKGWGKIEFVIYKEEKISGARNNFWESVEVAIDKVFMRRIPIKKYFNNYCRLVGVFLSCSK